MALFTWCSVTLSSFSFHLLSLLYFRLGCGSARLIHTVKETACVWNCPHCVPSTRGQTRRPPDNEQSLFGALSTHSLLSPGSPGGPRSRPVTKFGNTLGAGLDLDWVAGRVPGARGRRCRRCASPGDRHSRGPRQRRRRLHRAAHGRPLADGAYCRGHGLHGLRRPAHRGLSSPPRPPARPR